MSLNPNIIWFWQKEIKKLKKTAMGFILVMGIVSLVVFSIILEGSAVITLLILKTKLQKA